MQQVWALRSADRRNLSLIPHDLDYFQTHFIGKRMVNQWTPPPVKIDGKTLRLRDFVAWMTQAPVISERAKICLQPLIGSCVECLPFTELRGKPYYAVNVLETIPDCLDRSKSDILYSSRDPARILNVKTYHFYKDRLRSVPIFKIPDDHFGSVFVTQSFVDAVVSNKLTGAKFADPAANPFDAIMKGKSCNIVPGVWE